jgi:hypothetical protein
MPESGPVTVCRYEVRNIFSSTLCWMYAPCLSAHESDTLLLTSQVYNERIYDLLNEGVPPLEGWRHLEVKENSHGGIFVEGLKEASSRCSRHPLLSEKFNTGISLRCNSSSVRPTWTAFA